MERFQIHRAPVQDGLIEAAFAELPKMLEGIVAFNLRLVEVLGVDSPLMTYGYDAEQRVKFKLVNLHDFWADPLNRVWKLAVKGGMYHETERAWSRQELEQEYVHEGLHLGSLEPHGCPDCGGPLRRLLFTKSSDWMTQCHECYRWALCEEPQPPAMLPYVASRPSGLT